MRLSELILRDTRANQPVATDVPAGTLFCVTDEDDIVERSDGATWESYSPAAVTGGITQLTGDATAGPGSGSQALTIANNAITTAKILDAAVTLAKIANIATARILGRTTAASGVIEELTAAQATAILAAMVGDSGAGGTKGLVPAPGAGDALKFLRGDATWQTAGGTQNYVVTTVDFTNAQIETGNTVPVTIVAAPGAGLVLVPIFVATRTDLVTSKGANPTVRIRWAGDTTELGPNQNAVMNGAAAVNYRFGRGVPTDVSIAQASFDPRNKALEWSLSANTVGVGSATMKVSIAYQICDWN